MFDHIHRPQTPGARGKEIDDPRGEVEGVDILAEGAFDAGAQDLYRDGLPIAGQSGLVDLGNGGGGDRFGEFNEGLIRIDAQLARDLGPGPGEGLGRALDSMRRKPTWLRILLFPFEIIVWILFQVARLGRMADAVAIIGLCVLFLVLVVRIMKPDLLADVLPEILK